MRDKMQRHPPATMEMDVFGLRRRHEPVLTVIDSPPTNGGPMRHDTVLRLKDDSRHPEPAAHVNLEEVSALLMEQARKLDATFRTLGVHSSIAQLVATMMSDPAPASTPSPQQAAYDARIARGKAEEDHEAMRRDVLAAAAVPLAKRIRAGFSKVY